MKKCCICGKEIKGFGNNPYPLPLKRKGKCCDKCNNDFVIPIRSGTEIESQDAFYRFIEFIDGHVEK